MTRDSVRAELLKLRKRPAVWVLTGVLAATALLFGYVLLYVFVVAGQGGGAPPGMDTESLLATLLPDNLVATALGLSTNPGGPVALILGALAAGSEYRWGTVKTMALQRPTRGALVAGKLLALVAVSLALVCVVFGVAAAASLLIAALEGSGIAGPPAGDVVLGMAAAWLVLSLWAIVGAALAILFKGAGLAIGLGLVYTFVIESLVAFLPLTGRVMNVARDLLISSNVSALSTRFGNLAEGFGPDPADLPEPSQAVLVLAIYLLVAAACAFAVFRGREVT